MLSICNTKINKSINRLSYTVAKAAVCSKGGGSVVDVSLYIIALIVCGGLCLVLVLL